jgi:hypothetical protein
MNASPPKLGRPTGREFPERIVTPCTADFKQRVTAAAKEDGMAMAPWIRQTIEDRLARVVRVTTDGGTELWPDDDSYSY